MIDELLAQAGAQRDKEICGLIGAHHGQARRLYPIANIAVDPTRRFTMDPKGQIDAMRHMREAAEQLYAIYHSHPQGAALPSPTDLAEAAYPQAFYLILAWGAGDEPLLRAFRLDGAHYVEHSIHPATSLRQDPRITP